MHFFNLQIRLILASIGEFFFFWGQIRRSSNLLTPFPLLKRNIVSAEKGYGEGKK